MERNGCLGVEKIERKWVFGGEKRGVWGIRKGKWERPQKRKKKG